MSDLPNQPSSSSVFPSLSDVQRASSGSLYSSGTIISTGGKEGEHAPLISSELPIQDLGKEIELPKEVASVGVKVQPTTVPLPPSVQQFGVKASGTNVPVKTHMQSVPLTYTQINQGLQKGITTSFRWLSEWCVRRLKQLHLTA